jgi:hypothetical protein
MTNAFWCSVCGGAARSTGAVEAAGRELYQDLERDHRFGHVDGTRDLDHAVIPHVWIELLPPRLGEVPARPGPVAVAEQPKAGDMFSTRVDKIPTPPAPRLARWWRPRWLADLTTRLSSWWRRLFP